MAWFEKLCRKSGLLVHDLMNTGSQKRTVSRKVEEKQVNDKVTLRRTTIEEIEVKPDKDGDGDRNRG